MKKNNVQFGGIISLATGTISAITCFISRTSFGSPMNMMHRLSNINIIPPIWILNLFSFLFCFMIGFSAGLVIEAGGCKTNVGERQFYAYRGGLFIIISFFLSLIRYHVFFMSEKLFMSLIISTVSTVSICLCTLEWSRVAPIRASVIVGLCSFFELYLTVLILIVFLKT